MATQKRVQAVDHGTSTSSILVADNLDNRSPVLFLGGERLRKATWKEKLTFQYQQRQNIVDIEKPL